MKVGAIFGGESERVAIVQEGGRTYVVGVGDRVGEAIVVEIRDDKVVMRKGAVTFDLPYATPESGQISVVGVGAHVGETPAVEVQIHGDTVVMFEVPYAGGQP